MAAGRVIHALLFAALFLLLLSQAAFFLLPRPGVVWSIEPVLYALVPALGFGMLAERLPLRTQSRAAGAMALVAAAFAGLYGYLEATHWFVACMGCSPAVLSLSGGSLLAFAAALVLAVAGSLAFTLRPQPAARAFTRHASIRAGPATQGTMPGGRVQGMPGPSRATFPPQASANVPRPAKRPPASPPAEVRALRR